MSLEKRFQTWEGRNEEIPGVIIFHKKPHRNSGSEDNVCLKGALHNCPEPYRCPNLYTDKTGCFCTLDGQTVGGILVQEDKHSSLVQGGAYGAHETFGNAVKYHGIENRFI